ncbi:MAG: DMT family transporter [Bryobacterales bacterium]
MRGDWLPLCIGHGLRLGYDPDCAEAGARSPRRRDRRLVSLCLRRGLLNRPAWRARPTEAPELTRGEIVLLVVTVLTFSANNLTFMLGLNYISPTASQVLIQLAPLLVIGAGVFVFGEPFGGLQWIGTPVLAGGILLFFHTQLAELASGVSTSGTGILLISIAALCWAAFAVGQKRLLPRFGSFRLMWMVYAVGVVLMSPLAAPGHAVRLTGGQALLLSYSCLTTVLGYALFSEALKLWEASRVGAVVAVTPLFTWTFSEVAAGLFPELVHAEAADGWSLVGALCVAGGSALAALGRKTTGVISARPFRSSGVVGSCGGASAGSGCPKSMSDSVVKMLDSAVNLR